MALNNRLQRVATRGCLIAALAIAAASHAQDSSKPLPLDAPAGQAGHNSASPPATISDTVRVDREEKTEPDWNNPKCGEAKSHDEADLCEQRRMAHAAEQTVALNQIQIAIGIVGFALVFWNLWYARQATIAAGVAARAAEQAIRQEEELEAPFLYSDEINHPIKSEFDRLRRHDALGGPKATIAPAVVFRVKNFGKGPAVIRDTGFWIQVLDSIPTELTVEVRSPSSGTVVEPGASIPRQREFRAMFFPPIDLEVIDKIITNKAHIILCGEVRFAGVHGAGYRQTFGLRYDPASDQFVALGAQYNKRVRYSRDNDLYS